MTVCRKRWWFVEFMVCIWCIFRWGCPIPRFHPYKIWQAKLAKYSSFREVETLPLVLHSFFTHAFGGLLDDVNPRGSNPFLCAFDEIFSTVMFACWAIFVAGLFTDTEGLFGSQYRVVTQRYLPMNYQQIKLHYLLRQELGRLWNCEYFGIKLEYFAKKYHSYWSLVECCFDFLILILRWLL